MKYLSVSQALEKSSDDGTARRRGRELRPLRGIRGTPSAAIARILSAAWSERPPRLPADDGALRELFGSAQEDGLVAIGLAATLVESAPYEVLELTDWWLTQADDLETADAIGCLLLGPALRLAGEPWVSQLIELRSRPALYRRVALIAGLSALPEPIPGPAAAALRAQRGQRHVAWVEEPLSEELRALVLAYARDEVPQVRKAFGRLLRVWAHYAPQEVRSILDALQDQGGIPKHLREDVLKAIRKGERKQARG